MSTTTSKKASTRKLSKDEKPDLDALDLDSEVSSTEPQDHPFASIFDPWLKESEMHWMSARNTNAMTQASAAAVQGMMQMFQETGRFVTERFKKDAEAAKAFTECRTAEDYFRVQSDFFDGFIRDYGNEAALVAHMAADVTHGATKPIEDRTEEVLHSIATIPKDNGKFV